MKRLDWIVGQQLAKVCGREEGGEIEICSEKFLGQNRAHPKNPGTFLRAGFVRPNFQVARQVAQQFKESFIFCRSFQRIFRRIHSLVVVT